MLGNLGKLAKGKIFFESQDEAARALGARSADIVPVGDLSKNLPVAQEMTGLYTTREIADAFNNQIKGGEEGALSNFIVSLYWLLSLHHNKLKQFSLLSLT
jgi:hypothetical protein